MMRASDGARSVTDVMIVLTRLLAPLAVVGVTVVLVVCGGSSRRTARRSAT